MPTRISDNGGYSWWTRPKFLKSGSSLFFTAMTATKVWRVFQNDSSTFANLDTAPELDDHNAPAIVIVPGKTRHAFAVRHNASNIVNHFTASSGGFTWTAQTDLTHPEPGNVSYVNALYYNDKMAIFSRVGSNTWRFLESSDWGSTWGSSKRIFEGDNTTGQKYLLMTPDTTTGIYHLAVYGHPVGSNWRQMCYGSVDFTNGDISNTSGVIANLDGTNLPLDENSLDDIAPTECSEVARMLDIGRIQGKPAIVYVKWDDENDVPGRYFLAYRDASNVWVHNDTGINSGEPFSPSVKYYAGMSIDKTNSNRIAVAREEGGTSYIDVYPVNADMTLGTKTQIDSDVDNRLVRPEWVEGDTDLVWQELRSYSGFTNYDIDYYKEEL